MKLTISNQLALMALMTMVILFIVGVIGNRVANSMGDVVEYSEKNTLPAVEAIALMRLTFLEIQVAVLGHMTTWDDDEKSFDKKITESKRIFAETAAGYEKIAAISDDTDRELLNADRKAYSAYLESVEPVLEKSRNSQNTDAKELLAGGKKTVTALNESLAAHTAYSKKLAGIQHQSASKAFSRGNALSVASIILGMLILGGFSLAVNRSIGRGLGSMEQAVSHVETELDLTTRVPVRRDDEIGRMGAALNRLLARLQNNLQTVAQTAVHVSQSAEAMFDASKQAAATSEAQSSAASDMAASMEQLTVSINRVGDRATHTRQRVSDAGNLATSGESVVVKTVGDIDTIALSVSASAELINKLESQSLQISSIVNVIKEVADQTNLLALFTSTRATSTNRKLLT